MQKSATFNQFEFRETVEGRLRFLPPDSQIAFAARCAWRVLPAALLATKEKWVSSHFESILLACSVASLYANRPLRKSELPILSFAEVIENTSLSARESVDNRTATNAASAAYAAMAALTISLENTNNDPIGISQAAAAAATHAMLAIDEASFPISLYSDDLARWHELIFADLDFITTKNSLSQIWKEPLFNKRETTQWREWAEAAWKKAPPLLRKKWSEVWFGVATGKTEMVKLSANVNDWWSIHRNESPSSGPPSNEILPEDPPAKKPNPPPRVIDLGGPTAPHTDSIASADDLTPGAKLCAKALHAFLTAKGTSAPLTISVEGPWGGGKSSLMRAVQRQLQEDGHPTVWFNPWKHEAGPSLWAAFALTVEQSLSRHAGWIISACSRLQRVLSNMGPWRIMVATAAPLLLAWLLYEFYSVNRPKVWPRNSAVVDLLSTFLNSSPIIAAFIAAWALVSQLGLQFGSPLAKKIEAAFSSPTVAVPPSILTEIHRDFRLMLDTTVRPPRSPAIRTVFAFIDDLDRCEAPQAAELLQSLHMFINDDQSNDGIEVQQRKRPWLDWRALLTKLRLPLKKQLPLPKVGIIYILGMDSEKVAAAVATKHEKLLPLLLGLPENSDVKTRHMKLTFGNEFLEKFINLTLHLPGLRQQDLKYFVDHIAGLNAEVSQEDSPSLSPDVRQNSTITEKSQTEPDALNQDGDHLSSEQTRQKPNPTNTAEEALAKVESVDAPKLIAEWTIKAAQLLDHNPRRLKRFVNLLRLRLYLAAAAGIFESDADHHPDPGKLTFPQLAKLVALDIAHPEQMSSFRKKTNHSGQSLTTIFKDVPHALTLIKLSEDKPQCSLENVVLSIYFNSAANETLEASAVRAKA